MSYPREMEIHGQNEQEKAREREALIQAEAAKYLERIRTQDPLVLARQLAEEKVTADEQNEFLKDNTVHDELNPEILSENGFHQRLNDLLEEEVRKIHQRQRDGEAIPPRAPGIIGYLDLDRFKDVNDTYGHDEGDIILNIAGQLIASEVRPGDLVARLHGDEFAFYLADIEDMELGIHVTERIRDALLSNIPILTGYNLDLSASIGLVTFPEGVVAEQLQTSDRRQILINETLHKADRVHYRGAKDAGKNRIGVLLDNSAGPIKDDFIRTAVLISNPDDPAGRTTVTYAVPEFVPHSR